MDFHECKPFAEKDIYNYDKNDYLSKIVPDIFELRPNKNGTVSKTIKKHPKWRKFYKLEFSENITIWVIIDVGIISRVLLGEDDLAELYFKYDGYKNIACRGDFIRIFPKSIQRDFILSKLFNR